MILGSFGFLFLLISRGNGKSYCERNKNHVLCPSKTSQSDVDTADCQKNMKSLMLSKEDEGSILKSINFYREKVAKGKIPKGSGYTLGSPAANMMRAKWDEELAIMANKLSNLCKPYKKCDGCLDLERFPSTFVQSYSTVHNNKSTPYDWKSYIHQMILSDGNSSVGYSKPRSLDLIIWAEIYLVGCSLSIFPFEGKIIHNFVCAFGPVPDENDDYSVLGLPCTFCPVGSRCLSELDVLCDCETLCFPFKYVTLRRLRRQDDPTASGTDATPAAGDTNTEGGDTNASPAPPAPGGDPGSEPNNTDTQGKDSGASGDATPKDTANTGAGATAGGGDAASPTPPPGGLPDSGPDTGTDGTTEEPTTEGAPAIITTKKKSTAGRPISIGFLIQLLYTICVSKIFK